MKKAILFMLLSVVVFAGCTSQKGFIVHPVKFENGITDKEILLYAGDLKIMCAKVAYGGTALRYASTTIGRGSGMAAGLFGVAGSAGRGTIGILSLLSGAAYESQSIFDTKGKAAICLYGLQRIEKAEIKYAREVLQELQPEAHTGGEGLSVVSIVKMPTTKAGLDLYETILNTKKVMTDMIMGQIPERGAL